MPISIHGKEYVTVAERLQEAHNDGKLISITTEVLSHNPVVIKATGIFTDGKSYTGISSVPENTYKQIEKNNPYEVAETSAVGRMLGFAGFGAVESIASAEEVIKSQEVEKNASLPHPDASGVVHRHGPMTSTGEFAESKYKTCFEHDVQMEQQWSEKKQRDYWVHRNDLGEMCFGRGYLPQNS